jgi:hypothetical protein
MKLSQLLSVALVASSTCINLSWAAVSAEEAKQLGNNLTVFGAEKAGNKDGSIPEYSGGLPANTSPAGFKKGSGKWTSPFADEKPLFSITAQNADKYADKLTATSKALLKRYPSYRMDVYPSHRTVNYPKWYLDATARNATAVTTGEGGLTIENAAGGVPFPIPKTGSEVMWNHLTAWHGVAVRMRSQQFYVDANGRRVMSGEVISDINFRNNLPNVTPDQFKKDGAWYYQIAYNFLNPPRVLGDSNLIMDSYDPVSKPRKVWSYSASTRRVRLAPDIAYDTPINSMGGIPTYDDGTLFQGKQDRFDFKLVGKKEMYIPYSTYDAVFNAPEDKLLPPKHMNPDYVRWELHRVWVVEATLKPGLRHIYSKRHFYFDEDWSGAGASDTYDGAGNLYKGFFALNAQLYDAQATNPQTFYGYDLSNGNYFVGTTYIGSGTVAFRDTPWSANTMTSDGLVARSKQ